MKDLDNPHHFTVIRSNIGRKGNGREDPIRGLIQYFTFDGKKILEFDPVTKECRVDEDLL